MSETWNESTTFHLHDGRVWAVQFDGESNRIFQTKPEEKVILEGVSAKEAINFASLEYNKHSAIRSLEAQNVKKNRRNNRKRGKGGRKKTGR